MKRLLNITLFITSLAILSSFTSCNSNNEPGGSVIYYLDIVSCHLQPDSTLHFEQILRNDAGSRMLYPEKAIKADVQEGQRVLLQYNVNKMLPDSNYNITALQIAPVLHDTIISTHPDTIAAYPNEPLRITSIWRTGNYLNMDFQIEYYNRPHRMNLFYSPEQTSTDTINVILRHDRNQDAMGFWTSAYSSFYIPNLNQYKAMRFYANMTSEPQGYIIVKLKE